MCTRKAVKPQEAIFETLSSFSSLKENQISYPHETKSKAYVAAMKALQDKIANVESENFELREKLNNAKIKLAAEKQEWSLRELEEKQNCEQIEKTLRFRINELEAKEKNVMKINRNQEEVIKFLETKIKYHEDNLQRITEQSHIDKENLQLEIECANKNTNNCKAKTEKLSKMLDAEKGEGELLKEEISQQKKIIKTLEEELSFLRETSDMHKIKIEESYKHLKSDMIHKSQESLQLIKQLNLKNKSLQKLVNESKKQGDYYKVQCVKLSQRVREPSDYVPTKKIRSKSRASAQFSLKGRYSTPSLRINECSNSCSSFGNDEYVASAIKSLENEVKVLSDRYQKLQTVQLEDSGIEIHRRNLDDICAALEKKSNDLFDLKKQHQEQLKLKLSA